MHTINVRNVHDALPAGIDYLRRYGLERASRNGPVLVAPGPVTTVYERPRERVVFWADRDANPFFHLMESLWMLAGRKDVEFVANYVGRMREFSDDGKTLHGAYGHRWLHHFLLMQENEAPEDFQLAEINQVATIINMLKRDPDERRCVLGMWDPSVDLGRSGKDVPCNTQAYFSRGADGELNMTVCCRSNDMIWGAYGANAVHFSILQELMAAGIGCQVGRYWQISNNYHAYLNTLEPLMHLADLAPDPMRTVQSSIYEMEQLAPFDLVSTPLEDWMQDLYMFLEHGPVVGLRDPFFRRVAAPMMMAHRAYKRGNGTQKFDEAIEIMEGCEAGDWRLAGTRWLMKRQQSQGSKSA